MTVPWPPQPRVELGSSTVHSPTAPRVANYHLPAHTLYVPAAVPSRFPKSLTTPPNQFPRSVCLRSTNIFRSVFFAVCRWLAGGSTVLLASWVAFALPRWLSCTLPCFISACSASSTRHDRRICTDFCCSWAFLPVCRLQWWPSRH